MAVELNGSRGDYVSDMVAGQIYHSLYGNYSDRSRSRGQRVDVSIIKDMQQQKHRVLVTVGPASQVFLVDEGGGLEPYRYIAAQHTTRRIANEILESDEWKTFHAMILMTTPSG